MIARDSKGGKKMRVTQNMMVNNSIKWIELQTKKLNDATNIVAAGKQVNKPSDDPEATKQILNDRTTLSSYAQYLANIDQANTWIEADNDTLEATADLIGEAEDIVRDINGTDTEQIDSYLEELKTIYDQVKDFANSKYGSEYTYSGDSTDTAPFADQVAISGGTPKAIVFALAGDAANVTIEITDADGTVVRTLTVAAGGSEGENTVAWNGLDDSGNALDDGVYNFTISATDTSTACVASYPAYRGDTGVKEVVVGDNTTVKIDRNGGALFSEALSALSQAITAIESGNYASDTMSAIADSLESSTSSITEEQVTLSNIISILGTSETRWNNLTTVVEEDLSDIETGSTETAAVLLQSQETAYEVTLETAANILKLSKLSDYI